MRLFLILLCITLGMPILACAQWKRDGAPVQDESWRKSNGDFGAMLVLLDSPAEFAEEWSSTPSEHVPTVKPLSKLIRGSTFGAVVLFTGCKPKGGLCDATVDFKILKPDGTTYGDDPGLDLWIGFPPPPKFNQQLSHANLGIRIEDKDPIGVYQIIATVHDRVAHRDIELSSSFEVTDAMAAK